MLRCYIYHGQNRKHVKSLAMYNVVITTYYTVSAIWRQIQEDLVKNSDSIFSIVWHWVVLDEGKVSGHYCWITVLISKAHVIQNRQSDLAQSCCALCADKKWAITGTPIQNKLTDFLSIVKFLKVYLYSEDGVFEEDTSKPWQKGDPQGFLQLKTLV
jgi:SWI/SNF-related matrix-associated actin-dependent regulator of chromatin subfamily A3